MLRSSLQTFPDTDDDARESHATDKVAPCDTSERVGVEVIRERDVDVDELLDKLVDATAAESTTDFYYTNLRMHLAGEEDCKEISEDRASRTARTSS